MADEGFTDTDSDGTPDCLDSDDDGDGALDALTGAQTRFLRDELMPAVERERVGGAVAGDAQH